MADRSIIEQVFDRGPLPRKTVVSKKFAWDSPGEAMSMLPSPDPSTLSDAELRLIDALGTEQTSQRVLARTAGMSLGMTNLLIKRLVKKGLIKVVSLNGRTLSYILTPRGFAEKLQRSYQYLKVSLQYVRNARRRILDALEAHPDYDLWILGKGDLADLAVEVISESGRTYSIAPTLADLPSDARLFCLVCIPDFDPAPFPHRFEILAG